MRGMIQAQITEGMLRQLDAALKERGACLVQPMSLSSAAFLAWELRLAFQRTVIVIADPANTQEEMLRNLAAFAGEHDAPPLSYPALDSVPPEGGALHPDVAGDRINTLLRLAFSSEPAVVCTCATALDQPTISPAALRANTRRPAVGREEDPESLVAWLEKAGYKLVPEVGNKGEAVRRGGLVDVWPPQEPDPLRIEFFGETVETIRSFDPADQRSARERTEAVIPPATEREAPHSNEDERAFFMNHAGREALCFGIECGNPAACPAIFMSGVERKDAGAGGCDAGETMDLGFEDLPALTAGRHDLFEPDLLDAQRRRLIAGLAAKTREGISVHLFFDTPGGLDRFRETHPGLPFLLHAGFVSDGFINHAMSIAIAGERLLTGRRKRLPGRYGSRPDTRTARRRAAGETISDWTGIRPGELAVHVDHGIGRYLGITEMDFDGQLTEALAVEYADRAKLYVPVAQCHLLSRYIGAGNSHPRIDRIGSSRWPRARRAAERAVRDLAASLLKLQAMRESRKGFPFPADNEWQHDFEAAFPYEETQDQARAIESVKSDMEAHRPMDRLICGDAGYGKTEVALRAAFKAVTAGKQVALLVPTTVLSQQHYDVFADRMESYPFQIELLSRFRTTRQQEQAVRGLAAGTVDIAIGTHRLLQPDVKFNDLGLVIIDEEQRFGVAHKEKLKQMRQLVDVLTLTATPIPRTLYLSLTGARDISMIQAAPEQRVPVKTIVAAKEDRIVRDAVRSELRRGGQVYYLHNRIATIERAGASLMRLVPEARLATAHGLTPPAELSRIMHEFEQGGFDVLLCTTIIQSGLDIPNVNTILIDRADRFGMADLYQLRGRVGRSSRNAYAYLLLPGHERLLDTSRKRIHAILQHSGLGAGFGIAVRDLEIRGSGNLLGREQSGHIAAVGFDLYCQLLKNTVARLGDGKPDAAIQRPFSRIIDVDVRLDFLRLAANTADAESSAFLPHSYVDDEQLRLKIYRKIASATDPEEIRALRDELRDRFGPVPGPLDRLIRVANMRIIASEKGVCSIETKDGRIMLKRGTGYVTPNHRFPRLRSRTPDDRIDEILGWLNRLDCSAARRGGRG